MKTSIFGTFRLKLKSVSILFKENFIHFQSNQLQFRILIDFDKNVLEIPVFTLL